MGKIKYVAFYDGFDSDVTRLHRLSAVNKINYISKKLTEIGYLVEIITPSWVVNSKFGYYSERTFKASSGFNITYLSCLSAAGKISRKLSVFFCIISTFLFFIRHVKKSDIVLVYHSPLLAGTIFFAKKLIKFKLILEVEEIYGEVWPGRASQLKKENQIFQVADAYICASDALKYKFLHNGKYSIVLYGVYDNNSGVKNNNKNNGLKCIRIIFAGEVEEARGGAFCAIKAMYFLPDNYILNIIGNGSDYDLYKLANLMNEFNESVGSERVKFHGEKKGADFCYFLKDHDIALNPQKTGSYMNSAFPSKIISYISHGLVVVSSPVKSIMESQISELINFSLDDSPESIAIAIMQLKYNVINFEREIVNLDENFKKELNFIIKNI